MPARAAEHLQASSSSGSRGPSAAAAGAAAEALPAQCRICWQEADDDEGGALLTPCRCSGSSRFVHQRCLAAWMTSVAERKGAHAARHCDICRAPYHGLPREMRVREPPLRFLRRHAEAALATPAGTVVSYYLAAGTAFSAAWAVHGAVRGLAVVPEVVRASQQRPLQSMVQLAPELLLSVAAEGCLTGEWAAPLVSVTRFCEGVALSLILEWTQLNVVALLPRPLLPLATGVCMVAQLAAATIQYTHMALLMLFGGMAKGFARGMHLTLLAPVRFAASAADALSRCAASAAGLVPALAQRHQRRGARRRKQPPPARGRQQQVQRQQQRSLRRTASGQQQDEQAAASDNVRAWWRLPKLGDSAYEDWESTFSGL